MINPNCIRLYFIEVYHYQFFNSGWNETSIGLAVMFIVFYFIVSIQLTYLIQKMSSTISKDKKFCLFGDLKSHFFLCFIIFLDMKNNFRKIE